MMSLIFARELEVLRRRLLEMGAEAEEELRLAMRAFSFRDADLARKVLQREEESDAMDVAIEEECLKILALHQPVARDLRCVITALKIASDLERISDLSANIAKRSLALQRLPTVEIPFRLDEMGGKVQDMLRRAMEAFVNLDARAAYAVCASDGEINEIKRATTRQVREAVLANAGLYDPLMQTMHISRHLERIADHCTNICENIIYLVEGKIVRHTDAVAPQNPNGAAQEE